MMQVVYSKRARLDLVDVWEWLALYTVQAGAVRIVRIVDGAIDLQRIEWPIEETEE